MASKIRVKVNKKAIEALENSPEAEQMVGRMVHAIKDACNAQSSWGGYDVAEDFSEEGSRAVVIDIAEPSTDTRRQRLLSNLDAARF